MQQDYIRAKEAPSFLGVSKSTFYRYAKDTNFPKKIHIHGIVVYPKDELTQWIELHRVVE